MYSTRLFKLILLLSLTHFFIYGQYALPQKNINIPVAIASSVGEATGFYFNYGQYYYLVTAKHVLFDTSSHLLTQMVSLVSYGQDITDTTRNIIILDLNILQRQGNVHSHTTQDIAAIKVFKDTIINLAAKIWFLPGVNVLHQAKSGFLSASAFTKYESVIIGNNVFIQGYPSSLGIKNFPQIDYFRPLLRKGVIAGKNNAMKTIILDCPVYQGNSGSPVTEVDESELGITYRIIGIISSFVPYSETWLNLKYTNIDISNSGYSVAIPLDRVLEIID
jgi:hypothetical protein